MLLAPFGRVWASKSAALLAAPGVLEPTAFYACINILHFLTRGGGAGPEFSPKLIYVGAMLAHFSLLGAFFSHFGLDFGAFWASKSAALLAAPGVLEPTAFYACINILLFLP